MGFIKTKAEFQLMKDKIINKIDKFINDYDNFIRKTSSKYWRVSGSFYSELKKIKEEIPRFEPLTMKELENDWVRDNVFTDEEKREWKEKEKFNI